MSHTGIVYDDIFMKHETLPGHPERAERLGAILDMLDATGLRDELRWIEPRDAALEDLARIHEPHYVDFVRQAVAAGERMLDIGDTCVGPHSYAAALKAAGAVLEAIDAVAAGGLRDEAGKRDACLGFVQAARSAAVAPGGVVLLLAHWGNWEIGGLVCGRLGFRHAAVGRAYRSKSVMRFLNESRARGGTRFIDKHEAVRPVLAALRAGESVGFFIDQTTSDRSTLTTFFGRPCKTPIGPAGFAIKTGAPVVPIMCPRLPDGRCEARFHPEIERPHSGDVRRDVEELTQRVTRFVEERVRERPGQWLWMHRRWKPPENKRYARDFRYVETILVAALDAQATAEATGRVCAFLKEAYPHARLTVLASDALSCALTGDSRIDEVIADERGLLNGLRLARRLRRRLFHVAIVLGDSARAAILARLAGIPLRVGSSDQPGRWLLTHRAPPRASDEKLVGHWLRVAATLVAPPTAAGAGAPVEPAVASGASADTV